MFLGRNGKNALKWIFFSEVKFTNVRFSEKLIKFCRFNTNTILQGNSSCYRSHRISCALHIHVNIYLSQKFLGYQIFMVQFYSKLFSSYEFLNFKCEALVLMARVGTGCTDFKKLSQGFQVKLLCCRLTIYCCPCDRIVSYLSFRVPVWTHVWEYFSGLTQKIWNSPWLTHLI